MSVCAVCCRSEHCFTPNITSSSTSNPSHSLLYLISFPSISHSLHISFISFLPNLIHISSPPHISSLLLISFSPHISAIILPSSHSFYSTLNLVLSIVFHLNIIHLIPSPHIIHLTPAPYSFSLHAVFLLNFSGILSCIYPLLFSIILAHLSLYF